MSSPLRPPKDWGVYETNEVAPGVFALDAEQSERLLAETCNEKPCPGCGGRVWGALCRRCDMLMPPGYS